MNENIALSDHERLDFLEKKVEEQEAQISGLVHVLSDLLAAQTVLHKDVRPISFIREYRNSDHQKAADGGTQRVPKSFFDARFLLFDLILDMTANSPVFDHYWFRRFFWRSEEQERVNLANIREAIERKRDAR